MNFYYFHLQATPLIPPLISLKLIKKAQHRPKNTSQELNYLSLNGAIAPTARLFSYRIMPYSSLLYLILHSWTHLHCVEPFVGYHFTSPRVPLSIIQ